MIERKPRLLYILHAYHNRAGTEMHTKQLARLMADDFDVYLAYPERGLAHLMRPNGIETHLPGEPPQWPVTAYNQGIIENSLKWIMEEVSPDLIHIQHFIYWPLSLIDFSIVSGKPVVVTFHDYYAITPHFTMEGVDTPQQCFTPEYAAKLGDPGLVQYLIDRRNLLGKSLTDVTMRLAPSAFTAGIIKEVFNLPITVLEHGIPEFKCERGDKERKGVRFGYVGSLLPQKGWESLIKAFEILRAEMPASELHVWGGKAEITVPGVTFHGVYEQRDLPRIFRSFDVGVIPSIFRESYSLALSELWMAGLPVIASNIGALGDRVREGINGKKFPPGDAQALYITMRWFCEHDEWRGWKIEKPRSEEEMADEYRMLYAQLLMRS